MNSPGWTVLAGMSVRDDKPVDGRLRDAVGETEVLFAVEVDDRVEPLDLLTRRPVETSPTRVGVALLERGVVAREHQQQHVDARRVRSAPQPTASGALAPTSPSVRRRCGVVMPAVNSFENWASDASGKPSLRSPLAVRATFRALSAGWAGAGVTWSASPPSQRARAAGVVDLQQHVAGGLQIGIAAGDQPLDVVEVQVGHRLLASESPQPGARRGVVHGAVQSGANLGVVVDVQRRQALVRGVPERGDQLVHQVEVFEDLLVVGAVQDQPVGAADSPRRC